MGDITWDKRKRYIITRNLGLGTIVVLTDIKFWNMHYEELKDWCDKNLAEIHGMTVDFPNEKTLTLFCLQWSQ
jgi:hypothetical protein